MRRGRTGRDKTEVINHNLANAWRWRSNVVSGTFERTLEPLIDHLCLSNKKKNNVQMRMKVWKQNKGSTACWLFFLLNHRTVQIVDLCTSNKKMLNLDERFRITDTPQKWQDTPTADITVQCWHSWAPRNETLLHCKRVAGNKTVHHYYVPR